MLSHVAHKPVEGEAITSHTYKENDRERGKGRKEEKETDRDIGRQTDYHACKPGGWRQDTDLQYFINCIALVMSVRSDNLI